MEDTELSLTFRHFFFVHPFSFSIRQHRPAPAEGDVGKVTYLREMTTQPKSEYRQCLTVTNSMRGRFKCPFVFIAPGLSPASFEILEHYITLAAAV